jgi:hypothetical protein
MKSLEGYRFPGPYSLSDPLEQCLVQGGIEVAWMHSDHFLPAVTQALTRLSVDVEKGLVLVEQEKSVRRMIDETAKAGLARAQLILCLLALCDVAHQAQKQTSVPLKLADANLHREGGAILAAVAALDREWLPGDDALLQVPDRGVVEADIEIASMFADEFFTAVAETVAGLAVDVDNGQVIVKQKEAISRVVHERAVACLAGAQLGRKRGHEHRRREEHRQPDNIVWIIDAEAEQWRHEEVVQACYGNDRQNDGHAQAAQQRHERDENHIDKGRPRHAEANVKADGGDQCQAGDTQQELGGNGL